MIREASGNILLAAVDALVNPVNCVGIMGKGLALQFKLAFPKNFREYAQACKAGKVAPGQMLTSQTGRSVPRFIINFPTKRRWSEPSRLDDIDIGLVALVAEIARLQIHSVAVPPLGCGLGGLQWSVVGPKIRKALSGFPDVDVQLFGPEGGSRWVLASAPVGAGPLEDVA